MFVAPDRRRIYLLRHGEAAYIGADGTPVADTRVAGLTANGQAQARTQAGVLADVSFDRAVCSGLVRTVETAGLLLEGRAQPTLEIVPALAEIEGGDRHQRIDDFERWLKHVANPWGEGARPDGRFLGGERFADFEARVVPAFEALIRDRAWRTLLIVAHGGVNRLLLNYVMNLRWQHAVSVEQDACCINVIDVDRGRDGPDRFLIRGINITGYNLSKAGIVLTDMEKAAERISASIDRQR